MQETQPARTAIVYDFDGTLAPGNIQEHTLIPEHLQTTPAQFWDGVGEEKQRCDADEILVYLRRLVQRAAAIGKPLTEALLGEHGARVPLFEGVESWFARINSYAAEKRLHLEHYVISSGNFEIIRHTKIAHEFKTIYGSKYMYDEQGHAMWPAVAINYTTKTQYLFRINKGVPNSWNNELVNRWQPMAENRRCRECGASCATGLGRTRGLTGRVRECSYPPSEGDLWFVFPVRSSGGI